MGADGHIAIWNDEQVRDAFPDCDELFACLPTHYSNELDGVKYHHCYWGDNMWVHWTDPEDWYIPNEHKKDMTRAEDEERLRIKNRLFDFVSWLDNNYTHWEVWT